MEFTKEQFTNWRDHPVTQEVLKYLDALKAAEAESMATGGSFVPENADATQALTARAMGKMTGLDTIREIIFEGIPMVHVPESDEDNDV